MRGFLDNAIENAPKTTPIPTPGPTKEIVAKPDAKILQAWIMPYKIIA